MLLGRWNGADFLRTLDELFLTLELIKLGPAATPTQVNK